MVQNICNKVRSWTKCIENISYRRGAENRATVLLLSDQSHFCVDNDLDHSDVTATCKGGGPVVNFVLQIIHHLDGLVSCKEDSPAQIPLFNFIWMGQPLRRTSISITRTIRLKR